MTQRFDIIIVGGGMVGLACARLLAKTDLRIAIVDEQSLPEKHSLQDYDLRVSALSQTSAELLQRLDCWQPLQAKRIAPYEAMKIWEQNADYTLTFDAAEFSQAYLGYIVENSLLREVLLAAMPDNITLLSAVKLQQCQITKDSIQLTDDQGQTYQAQLAIAADGANSWLRQQAGISVTQYPYQQRAIVATIKTEQPHQNTAYQCFLATGPVAMLPLDSAHHCSLVWSADTEYAEQLLVQSEMEFNQSLSAVVESHLGRVHCVSQRLSFPLQMRHADTYVQPRIALIGDAVRTIHPLAGQGVNLGLQDAHALAQIITKAFATKRDFASEQQLKKYQRARKSASLTMIVAMEFFKQAFARQDEKAKALRQKTISTIEKRQWLKRLFAAVARGEEVF